jgi:ABC-2 type transport system permease protein
MQQMGDDEAVTESLNFKEKLKKRNAFSSTAGMFFPSIHAQLSLNALSLSDMDNYLNFIEKLENFHEQKRLYFYPKIFNEAAVSYENWKRFGLEFYQEKPSINWLKILLPLILSIAFLLIISKKIQPRIHELK